MRCRLAIVLANCAALSLAGCRAVAPSPSPPPVAVDATSPPPIHPQFRHVPLVYPARAIRLDEQGAVGIACDVSVQGITSDCRILWVQGDPVFGPAALQFIETNTYQPATRNGVPIATRHAWIVNYRLPTTQRPAP